MIRWRAAGAAIFVCAFACAPADTPPNLEAPGEPPHAQLDESAEQVLTRARDLYSKQGPTEALPLFERALELYRRDGDRTGEAVTLGLSVIATRDSVISRKLSPISGRPFP